MAGRDDLWYLQWTLLESAFVPIGAAAGTGRRTARGGRRDQPTRPRPPRRGDDPRRVCWLHRSRGAYEDALYAGRRAVAPPRSPVGGMDGRDARLSLARPVGPRARSGVLERGLAAAERLRAPNEIARCLGQLAWARCCSATSEAVRLRPRREAPRAVSTPIGGAFLFGAHAYAAMARVQLATGAPEQRRGALLPLHGRGTLRAGARPRRVPRL